MQAGPGIPFLPESQDGKETLSNYDSHRATMRDCFCDDHDLYTESLSVAKSGAREVCLAQGGVVHHQRVVHQCLVHGCLKNQIVREASFNAPY